MSNNNSTETSDEINIFKDNNIINEDGNSGVVILLNESENIDNVNNNTYQFEKKKSHEIPDELDIINVVENNNRYN